MIEIIVVELYLIKVKYIMCLDRAEQYKYNDIVVNATSTKGNKKIVQVFIILYDFILATFIVLYNILYIPYII